MHEVQVTLNKLTGLPVLETDDCTGGFSTIEERLTKLKESAATVLLQLDVLLKNRQTKEHASPLPMMI